MKIPLALFALVLPLTLAQDAVPDLVCPIPDVPLPGTEPPACSTECNPPSCSDEGQLCCPTRPSCRDCVTAIRTRSANCELDGEEVEAGTSTMDDDDCNLCVCIAGDIYCTDLSDEDCPATLEPSAENCMYEDQPVLVRELTVVEMESGTCKICLCHGSLLFCREEACGAGVTCEYNGQTLEVGDSVEADDGCNTCTCTAEGTVACTEIACVGCPDGTQPVNCFVDPCQYAQCPAVEGAECEANYCGGCNAEWFLDGEDVTESCQGGCPDGTQPVNCFIDPCEVAQCPAVEGAECEANYCGGCNAVWFLNGDDVTERCQEDVCHLPAEVGPCDAVVPSYFFNATTGRCDMFNYGGCGGNGNRFSTREECRRECAEEGGCPDGTQPVFCIVDPCQYAQCPAVEGAECEANYCGGCNAEWFLIGDDITERCQEEPDDRYEPNDYASCPPPPEGVVGTCSEECSSDRNCSDRQKCCSNGCGHACFNATFLPYYDAPLVCPPAFQAVSLSSDSDSCAVECQSDAQCSSGELCCRYGCSSTCQTGQHTGRSCSLVRERLQELGGREEEEEEEGEEAGEAEEEEEEEEERRHLYIPQCREDGTFLPVQLWSDLAWCVNVETGVPIGDPTRNSTPPRCPNCTVNGEVYLVGETFFDECNTCTCTSHGLAICTLQACLDPCSLPVATGTCEDQIQSYYYDSSTRQCQAFSYSGCGGNENRFSSVRDCLHACNPDSVCLLERDEGEPCNGEEGSPGDLFYYYNPEEGECDTLMYRGCGGNDNRFESGPLCLQMCDPSNPGPTDSTGLNCWEIQCDIPFCGDGVAPDYDDDFCCPVCPSEDDCDDDEFRCGDGSCISSGFECDGLEDCADGEDEHEGCSSFSVPCEFRCSDSQCVPEDYRCDGALDCDNALDEADCQDAPIGAPYYPPVRVCPAPSDILGACDSSECERDTDCQIGMCCPNNCFQHMCVEPIVATPICTKVVERLGSNASYVPQCTTAGDYQALQCVTAESTRLCWCVNAATGIPFTDTFNDRFPDCNKCRYNGSVHAPGEIYTAVDGCNQCFCSVDGDTICTTAACAPVPCPLGDSFVRHGETLDSDCISCTCLYGQLNCTRRECNVPQEVVDRTIRVEMRFTGDLSQIRIGNGEEEFTREVLRTLIRRYATSLGLEQSQITSVELREGSVIVIVVIKESDDQSGANVTVLTSQMEQDYTSGSLIIRYNNTALVPDGEYTSEVVQDEEEEETGLETWHIIVIVVAGVAIILLILVSITLACVILGKRPKSKLDAEDNEYVTEKMEMKADLSAP